MNDDDDIDIDDLARFCAEHPFHMSPEGQLETVIECWPEEPCAREAKRILRNWKRNQPSLEAKRARLAAFYFKWNFGPAPGEKVGRGCSLSMPYWTARTHCLNNSRFGPCVALVASAGTAPACLAKARYGSPD